VRKVGSTVEEPVDVRLVSATHKNLAACVEAGTFRQDLYYRLNVIELALPPLRERRDDIGLLSAAILRRLAGHAPVALSAAALEMLSHYDFPGNVRELENILERALAFASGATIEAADLALKPAMPRQARAAPAVPAPAPAPAPVMPAALPSPAPAAASPLPGSLTEHLDAVERGIIREALARTRYNRTHAAELLGLSLRQLRYRMQRLQIHEPE
jgi:two-component system response regulator PilR (NtrC family)